MTIIRLVKGDSYGIYAYQGTFVHRKKDGVFYSAQLQNNSLNAFNAVQVGDAFGVLFDGTRIVRFGTKITLN